MKLNVLRPYMENANLRVKILRINEPREATLNSGMVHVLVDGEIEGETEKMSLTVWNEPIERFKGFDRGAIVELSNCFIASFRRNLCMNVGRDSGIVKMKR